MIKAEWTNKDSLDLQPTCNQLATTDGDLISRQDAIERWGRSSGNLTNDQIAELQREIAELQREIESLPSAEPKTGEWNILSHDTFHCKLCGHTFILTQGNDAMNYCPNCGADMRKGSDTE